MLLCWLIKLRVKFSIHNYFPLTFRHKSELRVFRSTTETSRNFSLKSTGEKAQIESRASARMSSIKLIAFRCNSDDCCLPRFQFINFNSLCVACKTLSDHHHLALSQHNNRKYFDTLQREAANRTRNYLFSLKLALELFLLYSAMS